MELGELKAAMIEAETAGSVAGETGLDLQARVLHAALVAWGMPVPAPAPATVPTDQAADQVADAIITEAKT